MIYLTDYIKKFSIEKKIIKKNLVTYKDKKINYSKIKVILVWHELINENFLKKFPNVKAVIRYGVGYDNIDLAYLKKKKIIFCNNPDYGVEEVATTALSMGLSMLRKIHQYDIISKNLLKKTDNDWQENIIKKTKRISNLNLGVIGAGRIGSSLIFKAKSFFKNIYFYDPYLTAGYEKIFNCKRLNSLEDLLKVSDLITIHAPLNQETKSLINKKNIKNLKKGVVIVNTSRGGIIENIDIFYEKLINNYIGGLALDVLNTEPPIVENSKILKLWMENDDNIAGKILINPHVSYYSEESFEEMRKKASILANEALLKNNYNNRII